MMYTLEVSKEQIAVIQQLCDLALKSGGLQNLNPALNILNLINTAKPVEAVQPDLTEPNSTEKH